MTGPAGVSRCLTLWSVVGDDGHRLPGVLQGGGGLFVGGVTEVHPVHLKETSGSVRQKHTLPDAASVYSASEACLTRGVQSDADRQIHPKLPAVCLCVCPAAL